MCMAISSQIASALLLVEGKCEIREEYLRKNPLEKTEQLKKKAIKSQLVNNQPPLFTQCLMITLKAFARKMSNITFSFLLSRC